jgi:hypothetical protein
MLNQHFNVWTQLETKSLASLTENFPPIYLATAECLHFHVLSKASLGFRTRECPQSEGDQKPYAT